LKSSCETGGLLEWGQTAISLGACCVYAWALVLPA
jgi:hypothetical protein